MGRKQKEESLYFIESPKLRESTVDKFRRSVKQLFTKIVAKAKRSKKVQPTVFQYPLPSKSPCITESFISQSANFTTSPTSAAAANEDEDEDHREATPDNGHPSRRIVISAITKEEEEEECVLVSVARNKVTEIEEMVEVGLHPKAQFEEETTRINCTSVCNTTPLQSEFFFKLPPFMVHTEEVAYLLQFKFGAQNDAFVEYNTTELHQDVRMYMRLFGKLRQ